MGSFFDFCAVPLGKGLHEEMPVHSVYFAFPAYIFPCTGAVLHLYQNSSATGRKARQSPEWRYHLPGYYTISNYGIYWISLVEK